MTARKLTLRGQALAELTDGELGDVAAGATSPPRGCFADTTERLVRATSRVIECASVLEPCISSTC